MLVKSRKRLFKEVAIATCIENNNKTRNKAIILTCDHTTQVESLGIGSFNLTKVKKTSFQLYIQKNASEKCDEISNVVNLCW